MIKRVMLIGEVVEELKYEKNQWYTLKLEDGTKITINKKYCDEEPFLRVERLEAFAEELKENAKSLPPLPDVKFDTDLLQKISDGLEGKNE